MSPGQNEGKSKLEKHAGLIAAIAALVTALAGLAAVILRPRGIIDFLPKTSTPDTSPTLVIKTETIAPDTIPTLVFKTETAIPNENILFFEDFQDNQHSFYSLVGNWTAQEDPYLPGNKLYQVDTTGTTKSEESSAILIQSVPESFILELKVRFTQDNLVDRYFVSISWWENRNYVISAIQQKVYFVNRETTERFFEYGYNFTKNTWYTLKVEVNGDNAIFYLNGLKVGEVENLSSSDTMPTDLGFVVGEKSGVAQFDDFYVTKTGQ